MFTSGQLAKQCHTSIRTVQYYDQKGLLRAKRSQSNRREYDEQDLLRLQQIITYRQLGFTLKDIQELIDNRQASKTLSALIDKQTAMLHQQIHQLESQLAGLRYFKKQLQSSNSFSPELQAKVRSNMKMAKQLHHFRLTMVGWGLVIDLLFLVSLIFVISQGASPWRLVLGGSFIASHLRTTYFFLLPAFTIPLPQLSFRIRPRVQKLGLSPSYPEYPQINVPNLSPQKLLC